jgi:copper homeostasis protein CutC
LQSRWGERITILAGGGVRAGNVRRLVDVTGVREVHLGPRLADGRGMEIRELEATIAALRG